MEKSSAINIDVVLERYDSSKAKFFSDPSKFRSLRTKYDPKIDERILNVYQLGSRVYGTATEKSDW